MVAEVIAMADLARSGIMSNQNFKGMKDSPPKDLSVRNLKIIEKCVEWTFKGRNSSGLR